MQNDVTYDADFKIRHATENDAALVVEYMHKLGAYQKMADEITATELQIKQLLAENRGEAVFGIFKGEVVGFAYFCMKSSAFTGRAGLYIDGFLVDAEIRHKGFGKIIMGYLCKLALQRNCQMLEWGCLDWNAPTIAFYEKLGAYGLDGMTIFRFAPEQVKSVAAMFEGGDT